MTMTILVHDPLFSGPLEYRRADPEPGHLRVQFRILRPDGTHHDDRWYPCNASYLVMLFRARDEPISPYHTVLDRLGVPVTDTATPRIGNSVY